MDENWYAITFFPDGMNPSSSQKTAWFETREKAESVLGRVFRQMEDFKPEKDAFQNVLYVRIDDDCGLSFVLNMVNRGIEMFRYDDMMKREADVKHAKDRLEEKHEMVGRVGIRG